MEFASKIVCVTLLNQEDSFNEVMTKDLQESITVEITGFEGKVNSESKVWNEIRKINNCRISNDIYFARQYLFSPIQDVPFRGCKRSSSLKFVTHVLQ